MSSRELRAILRLVFKTFGGYSLDPSSDGAWIANDGSVYEEQSRKLEVIVSNDRVNEVRELFIAIGKQLGQRAIVFEVREGGEIIDLE